MIWTLGRKQLSNIRPVFVNLTLDVIIAAGIMATMALPFEFIPGVLLDARYTLLAIASYFGGPVGAALPLIAAITRRLALGGKGISVALPQIMTATAGGLLLRHLFRNDIVRFRAMALLALMVAVSGTVGFYVQYPASRWLATSLKTTGPFALIPAATTLLAGATLIHDLKLERAFERARRSLNVVVASMSDGLAMYDEQGRLAFHNPRYHEMFPLTADVRTIGTPLQSILCVAWERREETPPSTNHQAAAETIVDGLNRSHDRLLQLTDGRWIAARMRPTGDGGTTSSISK